MHVFKVPAVAATTALAASALLLAGCQTSPSTPGAQSSSNAASSSPVQALAATGPVPPAPQAGLTPLGNADSAMKTERPSAPAQLLVTNVRTGTHEGFERIVFDLEGQGSPGWFIDYTDKPAQQGSGNPVAYEGKVALNVNIDGTALPFEMNRPDPQIGTRPGTGGIVKQIVSAGTFEGRSQFIVGLDAHHPYSVQVLNNPTRLVIDVRTATQ